MNSFDLYREAKDHYDLMVPDKADGLILLSLYEKFGAQDFPEEKINETIDKIYRDLGRQNQRNAYDRNNTIILKLQEFFLWRDEIKKTYRFKAYGEDFCQKIKERLENRYSPAEIKRLFDSLYFELIRYLESADLDFNTWYNDQFKRRTPEIAGQIEILDQQVSESVREFRVRIKNNELNLFQLLEEIEISLDEIKQYANQLKEAFKSTYDTEYKLEEIISKPDSQEFISNINDVLNFNADVRAKLEQVSVRIDKIKPRIREFIYDFNQRDFDRKTVLFLNTLLKSSTLSKNDKGKRIISLPEGLPEFQIYNSIGAPRFTIVPDRDISPKMPVELTKRLVNEVRQEERIKAEQQRLFERQRVQHWFNTILQTVKNDGDVEYSSRFYEILKEENGNLSITAKLTSKLIRELTNHNDFKLVIQQEEVLNTLHPHIRIWKMQIQKTQL